MSSASVPQAPEASASAAVAGELVQLFIYDLSGGLARSFSQMLLGRQIEAIYHTSVVVGGLEHFFGGGINVAPAGATPFGRPVQVLDLGYTQLLEDLRTELLAELSERYTPEAYSLFTNNCNNFSAELAQLLCGADIPAHITGLPQEVLATPFGQMIAPMLSGLEQQLRGMRSQAHRPTGAGFAGAAAAAGAAQEARPQLEQPATVPAVGTAPAAPAAPPRAATVQQEQAAAGEAVPDEAPALHAAEVEIEAAVGAGMMQDAEQQLGQLGLQQGTAAGARPGQAGAPAAAPAAAQQQAGGAAAPAAAAPAAAATAASAAKLAAELEVATEYRRLMAAGGLSKHEAHAAAVEAVAARRAAEAANGGI
ncbi:desumoylating isopeptidase 1 [Micractinium conductrix]|uniref:Desumoylating isopeptidase 1 n=1 Tax=Micractinium conductrix TaxID=554055 RepID=A0A2P6V3F5_9CHLO|nr:desumoylating isopeptidase 1 [Micractinium conductrix]|eukprot:PSC68604.1 desumoylating isopeptidase 1 [Micractinium conductrix]